MRTGESKWVVLALLSLAIAGNYYAFDSVAPLAGLLHTQRGFSQSQIGLLNGVIGLPNIALSLVGGLVIDRFGAARAAVGTAAFCCVGAVLTAIGEPFGVMVLGRFLFGIGEETLLIALLAGVAQWFAAERAALAMSLLFSLARVGSYMADISPSWASGLYEGGWRPPLWLAAGLTGISFAAALAYWRLDRRRGGVVQAGHFAHEQAEDGGELHHIAGPHVEDLAQGHLPAAKAQRGLKLHIEQ